MVFLDPGHFTLHGPVVRGANAFDLIATDVACVERGCR